MGRSVDTRRVLCRLIRDVHRDVSNIHGHYHHIQIWGSVVVTAITVYHKLRVLYNDVMNEIRTTAPPESRGHCTISEMIDRGGVLKLCVQHSQV